MQDIQISPCGFPRELPYSMIMPGRLREIGDKKDEWRLIIELCGTFWFLFDGSVPQGNGTFSGNSVQSNNNPNFDMTKEVKV